MHHKLPQHQLLHSSSSSTHQTTPEHSRTSFYILQQRQFSSIPRSQGAGRKDLLPLACGHSSSMGVGSNCWSAPSSLRLPAMLRPNSASLAEVSIHNSGDTEGCKATSSTHHDSRLRASSQSLACLEGSPWVQPEEPNLPSQAKMSLTSLFPQQPCWIPESQ